MKTVKTGQFTKATIDGNKVTLQSICPLKESMAFFLNSEENKHLPTIERIDHLTYVMPYYAPLTSKHTIAWKQYKRLLTALNNRQAEIREGYKKGYNVEIASSIANEIQDEFPLLAEAIRELTYAVSNYTTYLAYDFKKANFSVDGDGNLILRDIYADMRQLIKREKYTEAKFRELTR